MKPDVTISGKTCQAISRNFFGKKLGKVIISGGKFSNFDFSNSEIEELCFSDCTISRFNFSGSYISSFTIAHANVHDCNFFNSIIGLDWEGFGCALFRDCNFFAAYPFTIYPETFEEIEKSSAETKIGACFFDEKTIASVRICNKLNKI